MKYKSMIILLASLPGTLAWYNVGMIYAAAAFAAALPVAAILSRCKAKLQASNASAMIFVPLLILAFTAETIFIFIYAADVDLFPQMPILTTAIFLAASVYCGVKSFNIIERLAVFSFLAFAVFSFIALLSPKSDNETNNTVFQLIMPLLAVIASFICSDDKKENPLYSAAAVICSFLIYLPIHFNLAGSILHISFVLVGALFRTSLYLAAIMKLMRARSVVGGEEIYLESN